MKKAIALLAVMISLIAFANDTTKLYNPIANVTKDVAEAVKKAKQENKHVLIQVGGNWCIWCYRFNDFVESDKELKEILEKNYIVYHLNYSKENKNLDYLKKLGFPQRFGFPVFVILNKEGQIIHTQDSGLLELGKIYNKDRGLLEESKTYNKDKVKTFFQNWSSEAFNESNYKE